MTVGSMMIGIAVLAVVVAYVARPFRRTTNARLDRTIEAWVAQARAGGGGLAEQGRGEDDKAGPASMKTGTTAEAINYCPQCGRRVESDDRFCSGCGKRLSRGGA